MGMEEARYALRSYDYVKEVDQWYSRLKRERTQSWKEEGEGFLRFDPENHAWVPIPYKLTPEFQLVGGLDFRLAEHVACFLWIWPPEYVERIYTDAWVARKEYNERKAAEKGQAILEATREARPEFTPEVAAAVARAVAEETAVEEEPKRRWFR